MPCPDGRHVKECASLTSEKTKTSAFMQEKLQKMYTEAAAQGVTLTIEPADRYCFPFTSHCHTFTQCHDIVLGPKYHGWWVVPPRMTRGCQLTFRWDSLIDHPILNATVCHTLSG